MNIEIEKSSRYCIALQPICDAQFQHVADELLYRAHGGASHAEINDPMLATARACGAAFYEIGLPALVGSRDLFLNVSHEWILEPDIMPLPPAQVVVELPHTISWSEAIKANIEGVRKLGYRFAVNNQTLAQLPQLIALVDIVKIDTRDEQAFDQLDWYREHSVTLLGQFIESADQLSRCKSLGFDFFQGYFYAIPELIEAANHNRSGNRPAQLRLIRELFSKEPDIDRLEGFMAQDPHLCSLLFRRVNSSAERRVARVSNIHQAIMMMGYEKIRALTATLLLSDNQPVKELLVYRSLVRAALAKRLAGRTSKVDPETAFTLGLFSLVDKLEGVSPQQMAMEAGFSDELTDALVSRAGELGKVLKVIEAFEQAQLDGRSIKLVEAVNRDYLASAAWAEEIMSLIK
ncbi:EAL and HDOD domain-containing protein [Nitrincola alkalilacustris]|uniref:EAL and HDOD domain-containing protein n=1 Tax=Nitrincola alkalilacustris TaxID=1571224 RepID=UPI00124F5126|nr:HDOD domain-containing protein [Nitrincola alkalilacustris]